MTKRLAIYTIYDKDGIIDDYIPFYLESLQPFVSHIAIVCNGLLTDDGKKKLKRFTKDVFVRPNEGFDAGAVKDVLLNLYGWEKVYQFDELLICNDSVYGPLFPLSECFEKMDEMNVDFWGIVEQGKLQNMDSHLQSWFLNIKSSLLKSECFRRFWLELKTSSNIVETVKNYEVEFTREFSAKGFKYSSYIDGCDFIYSNINKNLNYFYYDPVKMIEKYRSPFIKRKSMALCDGVLSYKNDLLYSGNEKKNSLINYIRKYTEYDSELILKNLIRKFDVSDIKNTLHLNYVLPTKAPNSSDIITSMSEKKVLVVAHLYYRALIDECLIYLNNVPNYIDILVTTSVTEIADKVLERIGEKRNVYVKIVPNHGRDVAALLVACRDIVLNYDYLCFTHDKDASKDESSETKRNVESFRYLLWENTLASTYYIENVLSTFEDEPRLGFLAVPLPYFGGFFPTIGNATIQNFDNISLLADKLGLNCNMSATKPSFAIGTAFWCRVTALKVLFKFSWSLSDFNAEPLPSNSTISHAIERIFPYVTQHEGYYSGVVMSDRYAAVRLVDFERMMEGVLTCYGQYGNYISLLDNLMLDNSSRNEKLRIFCERHPNLFIYGIGKVAQTCVNFLKQKGVDYVGFIVSDGKDKKDTWLSKPVYYLSEVSADDENVGIILGLSLINSAEVVPALEEKGLKNFFNFLSVPSI